MDRFREGVIMKYLMLISFVFLLCTPTMISVVGCQPAPPIQSVKETKLITYQQIAPFENIVITGSLDVEIHTKYILKKGSSLEILSDKLKTEDISVFVDRGTLYIKNMNVNAINKPLAKVKIYMGVLQRLIYKSNGMLVGNNMLVKNLSLQKKSNKIG